MGMGEIKGPRSRMWHAETTTPTACAVNPIHDYCDPLIPCPVSHQCFKALSADTLFA